jgi:alpha-methylacyl-CoA racemase
MTSSPASGPLAGVRVLEMEAIGPAPFCGLMLADMGADVLVVDRPAQTDLGLPQARRSTVLLRGRRSVRLDMKQPDAAEAVLTLAASADVLLEGFRPGVMERLGLGPDVALARNPRLVYARMTGWGQTGPLAPRAGHDIDYIALAGVLDAVGRAGAPPTPPLNLVGDFGGGGMLLAFGVACALLHARATGTGQVIDAAMFEGASLLAASYAGFRAGGMWRPERGTNILDSGAPWYDTYPTRDGRHLALGAIEGRFYAELLERLGLDAGRLPAQNDRARWPELRAAFADVIRTKTRDEWAAIFADSDACVAPVLSFAEAPQHPHAVARQSWVDVAGVVQPAPAPRFSATPGAVRRPPPERGEGGRAALADWGFDAGAIARLQSLGLSADS